MLLLLHIPFLAKKQKRVSSSCSKKTTRRGIYSDNHTTHEVVFQQLYRHQLVELIAKLVIKYLFVKKNSIYKALSQFRVQNLICRIMQLGSNYLTEYEYVKTNVQRFILIDQLVTNLSKLKKRQWNVFSNDSMEH